MSIMHLHIFRNIWLSIMLLSSCRDDTNQLASLDEDSTEDKARAALDNKNYIEAVRLYSKLRLKQEPEDYSYNSLLAASYGGLAGIDVGSGVQSFLDQKNNSNQQSIFGSFVPKDKSDTNIERVELAIDLLDEIPNLYLETHLDRSLYQSVDFLKMIYNAVMFEVNRERYFPQDSDGNFDEQSIANLSDKEIFSVLDNLKAMITAAPEDNLGEALLENVDSILLEINSDQNTNEEKRASIIKYMQEN